MAHHPAHGLDGDREDPAGSTWIWIAMFSAALVVTVLIVTAVAYNSKAAETERKQVATDLVEIEALRAEQTALLEEGPLLVDYTNVLQETETALMIPVDRAMDLVIDDLAGGAAP